LFFSLVLLGQQPVNISSQDTIRVIQIIQGQSLREKTLDSANIIETIKIKINFDQCDIIYYNDPQTEFNNKSESLNKDESNFTKQPHKITKRKHSD
jgi:hypothetical protein